MEKDIDKLLEQLKANRSSSKSVGGMNAQAYLDSVNQKNKQVPTDLNEVLTSQSVMIDEEIKKSHFELLDEDIERINQEIESDFNLKGKVTLASDRAKQLAYFTDLKKIMAHEIIGQDAYLDQLMIAFKRPFVMGSYADPYLNAMLICGSEGTGRHSSLSILAKEANKLGIFNDEQIQTLDLSLYPTMNEEKLFLQDFYMALQKPSSIIVFDKIEGMAVNLRSMLADLIVKGKIHLNKRYALNKQQLVEANNTLVADAVSTLSAQGKYLVFISKKKASFIDLFGASFMGSIHDICSTGAFQNDDCYLITQNKLAITKEIARKRLGYDLVWDESIISEILAHFNQERGIYSLIDQINSIYEGLVQSKLENNDRLGVVEISYDREIQLQFTEGTYPLSHFTNEVKSDELKSIYEEMDKIIGLSEIKEYILSLKDHIAMQQRRSEQGLKTADVSMHMIFTGNPGTGKTTIARLVSKYLKAIGALSGGQLVEVSRGDLVGRYVGHTAPLVNQVIQSAMGGVLFIDEAYSLYRGKDDSFGLEAIDTLVKGMEDNRDRLVVILAGYSKEMQEFLQANSGLKSRFPNIIEFPDYSAEEMVSIANEIAKGKDYVIEEDALASLKEYFMAQSNNKASGNGRLARNTIEKAILNQSQRLVVETKERLDLLLIKDFDLDK